MQAVPRRIEELLEQMPGFGWASLKYVPGWQDGHMVYGELRPFDVLGVAGVASMLAAERPSYLTAEGALDLIDVTPAALTLDVSRIATRRFEVEMWLPSDGSHPHFYVTLPRIAWLYYPSQPHLHHHIRPVQVELPTQGACVYPPHEERWNQHDGALIVPLTWGAGWIAAHAIWEKTGKWLGPKTSHNQEVIWSEYGLKGAQCQCGSSLSMRVCCSPKRMRQNGIAPAPVRRFDLAAYDPIAESKQRTTQFYGQFHAQQGGRG